MSDEKVPVEPGAPAPQSARSRRVNMVMWVAVGTVAVAFLVIALINMSNG